MKTIPLGIFDPLSFSYSGRAAVLEQLEIRLAEAKRQEDYWMRECRNYDDKLSWEAMNYATRLSSEICHLLENIRQNPERFRERRN